MTRCLVLLCAVATSCLWPGDSLRAQSQVKPQKEERTAQASRCSSSIHGRLWDFTSRPIPDGYVFSLTENEKTILGHSPTKRERGPDQGGWRIDNVPAGKIALIGFDAQLSLGLAFAQLTLKPCEQRFFNTLTTTISVPNAVPGGTPEASRPGAAAAPLLLLDLLGVVAREVNRVITDRQADDVRRRLLALAESGRGAAPSRPPSGDITAELNPQTYAGLDSTTPYAATVTYALYGDRSRKVRLSNVKVLDPDGRATNGIQIGDRTLYGVLPLFWIRSIAFRPPSKLLDFTVMIWGSPHTTGATLMTGQYLVGRTSAGGSEKFSLSGVSFPGLVEFESTKEIAGLVETFKRRQPGEPLWKKQ